MNGLTAKRLRNLAYELLAREGISGGEGYGKYDYIDNCISWEAAYDEHGMRMRDPEGQPLLKPVRKPGTMYTQWKWRRVYQNLKRLWKQTKGRHILFIGRGKDVE